MVGIIRTLGGGNGSNMVDQRVGDAYWVVNEVYKNLAYIKQVSESFNKFGINAATAIAAKDEAGVAAIQTAADRVQTAADRVQTALDVIATTTQVVIATTQAALATTNGEAQVDLAEAQAALATAKAVLTAADRVQTGLDVIATAADRVQTGLDAVATAADVVTTAASRDAALLSRGLWQTTAQGIGNGVAGTASLVAGSGGTNGTFALAFSGGTQVIAPKGYFVVAGGVVTQVAITYAGHYSAGTPTLSFAASAGLTGASTTAVMAVNTPVGAYFSVPVSGSTNEYLALYLNSSGTAVLQKTYPSAASVDNWFRQSLGAFFYNPHYEFSGGNLYFKPTQYGSDHFFVRGGYLPNAQRTYQQIKDSLLAQTPSLDPSFVELGATSPSGVTDCILLGDFSALWYNPTTNSFFAGDRNIKRQNEVLMIHNNGGRAGDCQEEAQIYASVESLFSTREAWKYECPIITAGVPPYFPNLDTTAGVLTLPNDTLLLYRNTYISIPASSINLLVIGSTAKKVYYNTATSVFEVKAFSTALTELEQLNLVLVATIRYGSNSGVSIACPYTVNGLFPGVDRSTQFAAIFTPLFAVTSSTNYPNYDTATRTFTLYQDTILSYGNSEWAMPSAQSVVVSSGSTANKVWWDTATNTLQTTVWNANMTDAQRATYVLVAAIRQSNVVPTVLSIMCPYTVNGDLFGQNFAEVVVPNPLGAYVEGIHHRGFSGIAPENTIPAYVKAAEYLNSYVEGDIQWTSDDVPVLLHDSTIDRTSNGTGAISGMTLATAKTYDFGSWKGAAYTGTTIPTFEEVLKVLKKLSQYGYFEIKIEATVPHVQQLLALLKKTGMQGNIEFDSFSYANLQKVVAEDPTQAVGYLGTLSSGFIASCVALKTGQNKVAAAVSSASVTAALVEEAHQNGIKVVCWTVNTAANVPTLAALGVDGIMTDTLNVAALLRASEGL